MQPKHHFAEFEENWNYLSFYRDIIQS